MIDYQKKLSETKNGLEYIILSAIIEGPKTRADLVRRTGQTDRANREAIERLRNRGVVIVSNSRQKGYRLPTNDTEVHQFIADMESRAAKARRTAGKVRRAYGLRDQQPLPKPVQP